MVPIFLFIEMIAVAPSQILDMLTKIHCLDNQIAEVSSLYLEQILNQRMVPSVIIALLSGSPI